MPTNIENHIGNSVKNARNKWNSIYKDGKQLHHDLWLERHSMHMPIVSTSPVIDLGCGTGNTTGYLLERGYPVIACDFAPEALETIKRNYPKANTRCFNMADGLPFSRESTNAVVADLSIHYFSTKTTEQILDQIKKILQPGGIFICRVNSINDIHHGAGKGKEIEPHLYESDGRLKRFFDDKDITFFFKDWDMLFCQETTLTRFLKVKMAWEIIVKKHPAL